MKNLFTEKKPGKRRRSPRLEKKLSVGAFAQIGFRIEIGFRKDVTSDIAEQTFDQFIELCELNSFSTVGICTNEKISAIVDNNAKGKGPSEDQKTVMKQWAMLLPQVVSVTVTPNFDLNYAYEQWAY